MFSLQLNREENFAVWALRNIWRWSDAQIHLRSRKYSHPNSRGFLRILKEPNQESHRTSQNCQNLLNEAESEENSLPASQIFMMHGSPYPLQMSDSTRSRKLTLYPNFSLSRESSHLLQHWHASRKPTESNTKRPPAPQLKQKVDNLPCFLLSSVALAAVGSFKLCSGRDKNACKENSSGESWVFNMLTNKKLFLVLWGQNSACLTL